MVDFASKLTSRPADMAEADIEALREAGFADESILDIVLITSLFNFMNRLADGLGVELDPPPRRGAGGGGGRGKKPSG